MLRSWRRTLRTPALVFALALLTVTAPSGRATAQGLISVGIGAGGGFGNRNNNPSGSGTHGVVYAQLHPPLFPFALRGDALVSRIGDNQTALSVMADAVVLAPIPFVVPYALVGFGKYGIGKDGSQSGWNAGVGVRARLPNVAIFAEVRRHQRISRDLFTIGLSR
ncbi:MAG: porin family protein [Gemmatimonadota bacterium]|nr:porin family protein [Gemmatimonadota bacterium]